MTRREPPMPAPPVRHAPIDPTLVPEHRGTVAFLSSVARNGDWVLPRRFRALAVMGNVEIDLTHALLGPGTSQIEVMAIMGSVTIRVPPDLRVECDGAPVLGSFEVHRGVGSSASPDGPLVRITGTALLASAEVKVGRQEK